MKKDMTTQKCRQAQLNEQDNFEIKNFETKGLGVISKDSNISIISDFYVLRDKSNISNPIRIQDFLFDLDPFFLGSD